MASNVSAAAPAWPRRVRLVVEGGEEEAVKYVDMPPQGAPQRAAALRAAAAEKCFPVTAAAEVALRFWDSEFWANVDDDDTVDMAIEIWRHGPPSAPGAGGRGGPGDMPTLRVRRGSAQASTGASVEALHGPGLAVGGSLVVLARGFRSVGDAARGCLLPGRSYGRVVEIGKVDLGRGFRGVTGYRVLRLDENRDDIEVLYWYAPEALCLRGSPAAAPIEPDFKVGAKVVLVRGFEEIMGASAGPLRPGTCGTILKSDGSSIPYLVEVGEKKKPGWYKRGALCPLGEPEAAEPDFSEGAKVVLARGFEEVLGAVAGPLRPGGVCGTILKSDGSSIPYLVEVDGKKPASGWYMRGALCLLGAPEAAEPDFREGTMVVLARGYGAAINAARGVLRPGVRGCIIKYDADSVLPYLVASRCKAGWYTRKALCHPSSSERATSVEEATEGGGEAMNRAFVLAHARLLAALRT